MSDEVLTSEEISRRYSKSRDEDEKKQLFFALPYALRIEALQRELNGWNCQ